MKEFFVTENHIKLLKSLYIGWDDTEFGSPSIDPKRPFGNSDVYGDMAEILGIELAEYGTEKYEKQIDSLDKGYHDLQLCLQILVSNLSIQVGKYIQTKEYDSSSWRKAD